MKFNSILLSFLFGTAHSLTGSRRNLKKDRNKYSVSSSVIYTIQVGNSDQVTNIRSDGSDGPGDIFTWDRRNKIYLTADLDDVIKGTAEVFGDNEGHCILLTTEGESPPYSAPGYQWDCSYTIYVYDQNGDVEGTISAHGPFNDGTTVDVITGGSGKYEGVTGSMELLTVGQVGDKFAYAYIFQLN